MALFKCPECQSEISDKADTCPHCGAPVPKSRAKLGSGCLVVFLLIAGIIALATVNSPPKPEDTPELKGCRDDWTKCSDNAQLVNNYSGWVGVKVDCKMEANKQARYGKPEWPWLAFGSFYAGTNYITSGTAVLVEPDAQFQNGFGAMVHSRVTCTYDLRGKRVISVVVSER